MLCVMVCDVWIPGCVYAVSECVVVRVCVCALCGCECGVEHVLCVAVSVWLCVVCS